MKNLSKKFNQQFQIAGICFLFTLPLMSFHWAKASSISVSELSACPTASFSTQNNGCTGPCTINFINQSVDATSYIWDFGDGNTSCCENPNHTYQEAGTYTVTLRAMGATCQQEFIGIVDIIGQ